MRFRSVARTTSWSILNTVGSGAFAIFAIGTVGSINTIATWEGFVILFNNNWVPFSHSKWWSSALHEVIGFSLHLNINTEIFATLHAWGKELSITKTGDSINFMGKASRSFKLDETSTSGHSVVESWLIEIRRRVVKFSSRCWGNKGKDGNLNNIWMKHFYNVLYYWKNRFTKINSFKTLVPTDLWKFTISRLNVFNPF